MYRMDRGGGSQRSVNIWPGFVDGLASLLLVVVFVLMVFVIAQFFLSAALSGRDEALQQLQERVDELSELLSLERDANADLRLNVAQLSSQLQSSVSKREDLQQQLASLSDRNEQLKQQLQQTEQLAKQRKQELEQAYQTIEADKDTIQAQLNQLATLRSLRDELRNEVTTLENTLAALEEAAKKRQQKIESLQQNLEQQQLTAEQRQQRLEQLLARLAAERRSAQTKQTEISQLEDQLAQQRSTAQKLQSQLAQTQEQLQQAQALSQDQQARLDMLNSQLASLRRQVARLNAALEAEEARNKQKEVRIANLSERLNEALANKVQELARYRSEFFGRLREVLGDNENIRVVGDRFVFQSEVLFDSGSATLGQDGRQQIRQLADTLKGIIAEIPDNIDWILRVDGHTDDRPIETSRFPSNWELSTARAVEVVKFLIGQGIPPDRLAATGFGEYQPIAEGDSPEALRKNRRIEFKLTTK
ncbi:peptidoglycan -binding protein [Rhodovibrio sodomensis]|nr:peptidoglycan -binding protein [Rhodovibrio sodomensis]